MVGLRSRVSQWDLPIGSRMAILCILSCLLIPRGVELQLGTIMIDSSRVLLTLFCVMAAYQIYIGSVALRPMIADVLMLVHVGAVALSAVYHQGMSEGLENAIGVSVDMGLAYFVARAVVRNLVCYRYYVRVVLIVAAISAIFGLVEMFTGYSIIRAVYHSVFPKVIAVHLKNQRLGLYRATATFRADILFGLYCMLAFALAACVSARSLGMSRGLHKGCLALCVLGVFASLSSGPWLALALCISCLVYSRIMRQVRNRWTLLALVIVAGFVLLSIASNRGPIKLIINYLSFSPETGYIRLAMFESVWALVPDYWPLGWGWGTDWPRQEWYTWQSIDCYYAVLFVSSGIFPVAAIVGFLAYTWRRLSEGTFTYGGMTDEARGWILGTVCLFMAGITVHIFGNLTFAVYFLLGAGQSLVPPCRALHSSEGNSYESLLRHGF